MKSNHYLNWLVFVPALICCSLWIESAQGNAGRPPANNTGAPGHQDCSRCHTGRGNGNVALTFSAGAAYQPGQLYTLAVAITDPNQRRFGFSMVARDSDNNQVDVGTWSPGSNDTQVHGPGNSHVGQRNAPRVNNSHTFTVNWTAPASGVGDVTFYVAANAANGNNSRGAGDNTYLQQLTISQAAPPNQPPTLTVPEGTLTVTAGVATPVSGIVLEDADSGDGSLTVTMAAGNGVITVADSVADGLEADGITNNGSAAVTLNGTLAQLNATFSDPNGIVFQSNAGFEGDDALQIEANDNGNNGGEAQTGKAAVMILVSAPANEAPSLTVPDGTLMVTAGVATPVNGIVLEDADSGDGGLTVTLAAGNGVITVADAVADGLMADGITDNGSAAVTLNGTLAQLNATFSDANGIVYQSNAGFEGDDALQIEANDNGNNGGEAQTGKAAVMILVSAPANEAPSLTVPDGTLMVTAGVATSVNGIVLEDADSGDGGLTVTLAAGNGVITVADAVVDGLMADGITDNGSAAVTLNGTLAQLNATFTDPNGIVYQSNAGFQGDDTLQIMANDNGNNGGEAQTADATIMISVAAPQAPPTVSNLLHLGPEGVRFTLTGVPGVSYILEHTEDFLTWELLEQVTLNEPSMEINDATAANSRSRYYRAMNAP